ncbi:conjugal transfer protein TraC [Salmonella enterica subsp. enterica serovar Dublin]|nr:DUF1738 domain-containing protein [Salmonella enterica subsp. enterica serovar Dublin]EBY2963460.1 DUF1738 domain-containing protein [Salmonella enterica subsp. enterica serovar Stanley]ECW4401727.1 DUF1738 domain-containing protein [Salmonella enterica subsp. enterica serovar Newport]EDE9770590.1 DUF1738 domain-containing protein [Salmonella enterica subsp. enterica serovar Enteritidis]EDR9672635.1 DUF1738 domain-containing protein [Salmonella enterica subsp. enterica]EEI8222424.1 DUF1738 
MARGDDKEKKPFYEEIADRLIKQLEEGTAPWQKPWEPGSSRMPHNPVSGTRYKGANALWLAMQQRTDPRWMTYKQAQSVNAQVQKGEKGTLVQYWKFTDTIPKLDDKGKPVLDDNGKKKMITVKLDRPKVFSAVVFNAEQIQGLPPLEVKATKPDWERHERAENILQSMSVPIKHDQADGAFYRPSTDSIHLPERSQFPSADNYYATALHEAGHSTGHKSRLDRDLTGRFGSESYAKEELRAEIASLMIGDELQIGHDPGQHAAYVKSWVKVLKDDPKEILRAAKDAEAISSYLLSHEKEKAQEAPQNAPESDTDQKEGNDSALPLKLAEKLAERFNNAEDRAKFMEKIQSRLTHEKPDTEIKIKETNTVVVSKKGLKQDTDLER